MVTPRSGRAASQAGAPESPPSPWVAPGLVHIIGWGAPGTRPDPPRLPPSTCSPSSTSSAGSGEDNLSKVGFVRVQFVKSKFSKLLM